MSIKINGENTFLTYFGAARSEGYAGKNCRPSISSIACSKGTFVEYEINELLFEAEISPKLESYVRQCCRLKIRGYRKTDYDNRDPNDSRSFDEVRADLAIELCVKMIEDFKITAEFRKDMWKWFVAGIFGFFSFSIAFCLYEIRENVARNCIIAAFICGFVLLIIGLIASIGGYVKADRAIFASIMGVILMFWGS